MVALSDRKTAPAAEQDAPPSRARSLAVQFGRESAKHLPVAIALAALLVVAWVGTDDFYTSTNLTNVVGRMAPIAIIAAGTTVLMIAGEIDLSIGSAVSIISILAAKAVNNGDPTLLIVFECIAAGALIGLIIGLAVTLTRAPAFMITLGALSIIAGLAAAWTHNQAVIFSVGFESLGVDRIAGIPVSVIVAIGVLLLVYVLLHHLRLGRMIFAVGGNEQAARLVGFRVDVIRVAVFVISGALVGLGAAALTSRLGSGDPTTGVGLELQVIAAVVIGGATLAGGHGSLIGSVLGVALLTTIANVLNLLGAEPYVSTAIFGVFIVLAVGLRGDRTRRAFSRLESSVRSRVTGRGRSLAS